MVLVHLTLVTFDPKINRVPLLPRTDVWTKFEEGRSRRSRVIDWKRNGYRRTDILTDMYKAICPLSFEGGIQINNDKTIQMFENILEIQTLNFMRLLKRVNDNGVTMGTYACILLKHTALCSHI